MSEDIKKKHRLKGITFQHEGGHIALVGGIVGGPANQQETVLWKSAGTAHISREELQAVLKSSNPTEKSVELEKAKFNSELRASLRDKVEEQFAGKYEWLYLEDFSEDQVVFSTDSGMFIANYSLSGEDEYVLEDTAVGVEYKSILVENGTLKLSKEAQSKLNEGVYSLVTKALDNPENNQRLMDVIKSVKEKAKTMEVEIQKAVDLVKAAHAQELAGVQAELTKATETLAQFAKEKQEAVLKARQAEVAKFDKDGAEALVKATEGLNDEAFAVILKSLEVKSAQVTESDLMKQVSDPNAEDGKTVESKTAEILKSRNPVKQ